ncbi:pectate lyase [Pedobacter sp. MC2016-24]|uniref:pectate lyase n=1 Tax=Pedobacter sp. MC2016-24 TaxID=2780090 RepID=UPI00187EF95B|nr:pectate lyase [Pedobacter sp. MC2016-24]MBE9601128.1 pectate lyase [Pedobacter sp. MC2016-24]
MKYLWILFIGLTIAAKAQTNDFKYTAVDPRPFADNANHWYFGFDKHNVINCKPNQPKYQTTELTNIADNILLFQKDNGGWPKNYDVMAILTPDQKDSLIHAKSVLNTTYDNGSTYTQIAVLANVYTVTKIGKYKAAALKGLDYILKSQYKNGGWPQFYPLESNYSRYVTYNDGNFEGIMGLLKDIDDDKPQYAFLDDTHRKKLKEAYQRAFPCILKTQINDAGKPTAWCQQYDEVTLQPAWARKFEPPSICNKESADLVLFLMSLEHPSKEIVTAVENAVTWFEESKILNTRVKVIPAEKFITPFRVSNTDRVVVTDSTAPAIWTRYYELKTHKPIFCDRDSKIVYALADIGRERRDGYAWYTYAPQQVLDKYTQWYQKFH